VDPVVFNAVGQNAEGRQFEIDAARLGASAAVVFETKAVFLREDAVMSSEPEDFLAALRAGYGASIDKKERDKGVAQLARSIGAIIRGEWVGEHGEFAGLPVIYPVLVAHDTRLDAPALGHFLENEFRALLGAVPVGKRVAPLTVMTIQDWETMMAMWRKGRPTLRSERSPEAKNRFLVKWQFGLAAIYAEAEDPAWAKKLSESEAKLACRYAPLELNGFPSWLYGLAAEHPTAVDRTLGQELTLSLQEKQENAYSLFLQNVRHASPTVAAVFVPRIRQWLSEVAQVNTEPNEKASEQNLRQAVEILRKSGNSGDRDYLAAIATERLKGGLGVPFASVWLPTLLRLRPEAGVEVLETGLKGSAVSRLGAGAQWFARLFDGDDVGIDLKAPGYTAPVLLRLIRAAYEHVHVSHDANHGSGVHEVDERDRAERGRNAVLNALLATTGPEGWVAKLEMANDPLFAHFKDRAIALAEEKAAEEADNVPLKESEFLVLDKSGEAPPATTEAMFALMRDRLDDLDDLLLQDESPREAWAVIKDEHIMRREIARALKDAAKGTYIVDQESVTADEKETDIRLRSTSSDEIGTIELKLGDGRPGKDLFNTLKDQLLLKYMAPLKSRAGCLLVTIAREREWENPKTGKLIGFDELIVVLNEEAGRLSHELGGEVKIMAKGLNLVPRLKTEKEVRAKKKGG
jgi:hypothetical protein